MTTKKIYLLLVVVVALTFSCLNDSLDTMGQEDALATVPVNEIEDLIGPDNGAFKTKSTNTLGLVPHLDLLKQEAIANSTAKLTVVPASTKYNVESSILLLKINNKTEKVLFSRIPLKDANTPNFTGNLLFTNLQGELLTLFKVNDGVIYKGYKNKYLDDKGNKKTRKKSGNGDCDENYGEGIFCYNLLDDVVIPVSSNNTSNYIPISYVYFYSFPSYTPSYTPSNSYPHTWGYGGSGGGYSYSSPDQIINNLKGDAKCVYKQLVEKNGNLFKTTIGKFIKNPDYHIQLNSNGICNDPGDEGCTDGSNIENGLAIINIVDEGRGTLDLAATILHEGIHAEIYKYVNEHRKGLDPNDRPNLLGYYFQYEKISVRNAQHQHMADKFVKPIAEAIRALDNNKYPLEDYMGFGWDGLRKFGWDGYYDNGVWKDLDRDKSKAYYKTQQKVLNNTTFNSNCN